jgi:cytochrome c553
MKTWTHIGLAAGLLMASLAYAQSPAGPAPDIGAGQKRAAACFACHNADGISKIPGTPHLAGQERSYLESALRAYRDGTRQNPTMNAMAKPLSDRDIVNIAAYYSMQTRMDRGQAAAQAK